MAVRPVDVNSVVSKAYDGCKHDIHPDIFGCVYDKTIGSEYNSYWGDILFGLSREWMASQGVVALNWFRGT